MKEVYAALEKLEGGAELVAMAKAEVSKVADLEAKLRQGEKKLEAFAGVDPADYKAIKEFVDGAGGLKAITETMGKAESNEAKYSKLLEDHGKTLEAKTKETEAVRKEAERLALENKVQPFFIENFNAGANVMKMAIDAGLIQNTESGLMFVNGATTKPLDAVAYEELKAHDLTKWALKTPAGGGEGGGVGGNNRQNVIDKNCFDV